MAATEDYVEQANSTVATEACLLLPHATHAVLAPQY